MYVCVRVRGGEGVRVRGHVCVCEGLCMRASCSFSHFLALSSLLFSFHLFFIISNREFYIFASSYPPLLHPYSSLSF